MAFKKFRGIKLPYRVQGRIYFALINYQDQPKSVRKRIDSLICRAAEDDPAYIAALRAWLLTEGESTLRISQEYHISESALYRARRKVYENW